MRACARHGSRSLCSVTHDWLHKEAPSWPPMAADVLGSLFCVGVSSQWMPPAGTSVVLLTAVPVATAWGAVDATAESWAPVATALAALVVASLSALAFAFFARARPSPVSQPVAPARLLRGMARIQSLTTALLCCAATNAVLAESCQGQVLSRVCSQCDRATRHLFPD